MSVKDESGGYMKSQIIKVGIWCYFIYLFYVSTQHKRTQSVTD